MVGIAGLWFLFGDSTEVFELLYSSPTTIRIERDTIDLDIVVWRKRNRFLSGSVIRARFPLLIRDVRPSCGCTEVRWEKRPVQPEKKR